MLMPDSWIKHQSLKNDMITPFHANSQSVNEQGVSVASYGLSSYGYDIRLGRNFMFFRGEENKSVTSYREGKMFVDVVESLAGGVIDPNDFDFNIPVSIRDVDTILIPPKTFFMGVSQERLRIPREVSVICNGKSTIARSGLQIYVTPLEPEWEGFITLEFYNSTDSYMRLQAGMGISQLQFLLGAGVCDVSYADRKGKYNLQAPEPIPPLKKIV